MIGAGRPGPIRSKDKNTFAIRDRPNVEVSWQVTGIRHDPYAEKHRIPVEEDKPARSRVAIEHPKEHGQAAAKGIKSPAAAHRAIAKAPKRPAPPGA